MTIKSRIKSLCEKEKISMNKLEELLGLGKGYCSKLDGSHKPNTSNIEKIANYFGVDIGYLMTGEKSEPPIPALSDEHTELIELYSKMSKENQNAILQIMRTMVIK